MELQMLSVNLIIFYCIQTWEDRNTICYLLCIQHKYDFIDFPHSTVTSYNCICVYNNVVYGVVCSKSVWLFYMISLMRFKMYLYRII